MINIQPIPDTNIYTLGRWISPQLTNSHAGFSSGTTSEWGWLIWDEAYTTTSGYTGEVRVDIVNASTNAVLLADIAKNPDGSPSDISSVGTATIKVVVKLYALDWPTPIVSNIRIKHKNWFQEQVITNTGKNALLNRLLTSTTTTPVYDLRVGNGQVTPITEASTDITNAITPAFPINGYAPISSTTVHSEAEEMVEISFTINNGDVIIPNGTTINSLGFRNSDLSQLFVAGIRHVDIIKDPSFYYNYKIAFKIYRTQATEYQFTKQGRNILLDRMFLSSPVYQGIKNGSVGYQYSAFTDTMTMIDSTYFGPDVFQYSILDTVKFRLTTSILMDIADGNGYTYNAITNLNDDMSPKLMYAAFLDEDIQKSNAYIYQFNTNHNLLTPISQLI